jgi:hypothetical protein
MREMKTNQVPHTIMMCDTLYYISFRQSLGYSTLVTIVRG